MANNAKTLEECETKQERAQFLSEGKVTTDYGFDLAGGRPSGGHYPKLRGMRIGDKYFESEAEAAEYGREFKEKCKRIAAGDEQ